MAEISKPAKDAWADLLRMIATSMARTPDEVAAKVIEGAEIIQRAIDESHVVLRAGFETALACGDSQRERIKSLKAALEATGNAMNALGIKELEHRLAEVLQALRYVRDTVQAYRHASPSADMEQLAMYVYSKANSLLADAAREESEDA